MDHLQDPATSLLTEAEVSARWRGLVSPGTLRNWRSQGVGPPFLKLGKGVLYPLETLQAWERRRLVGHGRTEDREA